MGLAAASRQELAEYARTVRALCKGEAVDSPHGALTLAYGRSDQVLPIIIAGAGPKMLELAGSLGDGVMLSGAGRADAALSAMLEHVRVGREQSNRAGAPFANIVGCAGAVDDDGQRAKAAVRPHVARGLLTARWERSEATRQASAVVRANYDYNDHMNPHARHAQLVPDEVVPEFAIAGTPDECVAQIQGLEAAGIDELTIYPYAVEGRSRAALIEAWARGVLSQLR
jgi:5,10-methylenetetrahydromethanopterin reductase